MAPEPDHRTAVYLRAVMPALAALAWLVLGATSAQADAGIDATPSPSSSVNIAPPQAAKTLAPIARLPLIGRAGTAPSLAVPGATASAVPARAVPRAVVAAVDDISSAVVAGPAAILPQVPVLPALTVPPLPLPSAELPDPGVVADLPSPPALPASASPAAATAIPSPGAGTAPPAGLPLTSAPVPSGVGTPIYRAPSPLLGSPSAEVSGWTGAAALVPGNGSGGRVHPPLTSAALSGLASGPGGGNGAPSQAAAEPAYVDLPCGHQGTGQPFGINWDLPENQAFPPGSSPD